MQRTGFHVDISQLAGLAILWQRSSTRLMKLLREIGAYVGCQRWILWLFLYVVLYRRRKIRPPRGQQQSPPTQQCQLYGTSADQNPSLNETLSPFLVSTQIGCPQNSSRVQEKRLFNLTFILECTRASSLLHVVGLQLIEQITSPMPPYPTRSPTCTHISLSIVVDTKQCWFLSKLLSIHGTSKCDTLNYTGRAQLLTDVYSPTVKY